MSILHVYLDNIYSGKPIPIKDLLLLSSKEPLSALLSAADQVTKNCSHSDVELCSIVNARSGKCSENCAFCAQSVHWNTSCNVTPLISEEEVLRAAKYYEKLGVHRFSLVTSGRGLSDSDLEHLCRIYQRLSKETSLKLCGSHGLITERQAKKLAQAGLTRYHCNLETSPRFFPSICTTHSIEDKLKSLSFARSAHLELCSGGIIGLGETLRDRLEMASLAADIGVSSFPLNILSPIEGTPFAKNPLLNQDEILLTGALIRFLLPQATIRYAGGRKALGTKVFLGLRGGINGLLTGDYLTTAGESVESDMKMLQDSALKIRSHDLNI